MGMRLPLPNAFEWDAAIPEDQIRLITIHSAKTKTAPVECKLTTFYRNSMPAYEALSYTWGSTLRGAVITCNGRPLRVTENCEKALKALRQRQSIAHAGEDMQPQTYVWIDAICINQQNTTERNIQVALMGETFRRAHRTVIYLGEIDHHARWMMANVFCDSVSRIHLHHEEALKQHWDAFFGRSWFTRTWVIQEVMNSSSLVVLIGSSEIPWSRIESSGGKLRDIRAARKVRQVTLNRLDVPQLVGMRETLAGTLGTSDGESLLSAVRYPDSCTEQESSALVGPLIADRNSNLSVGMRLPYSTILSVLRMTYSFNCKDPRDKLFALLSLFETPIPADLAPDYSKPVEEVYQDLAWYLIRNNNHEALVFSCGRETTRQMPSWAMDWRHDVLLQPSRLKLSILANDPDEWTAGFWKGRRQIYAERDSRSLVIKGFLMDQLRRVPGHKDLKGERFDYVHGPSNAQHGDSICVLLGFPTPFVLRRGMFADSWSLVGDGFVEGLMLGEALNVLESVHESGDVLISTSARPLRVFRIC